MANDTLYSQCLLVQYNEDGVKTLITWLPDKFAVQGKYLKLKTDGDWIDGWKIIQVYSRGKAAPTRTNLPSIEEQQ